MFPAFEFLADFWCIWPSQQSRRLEKISINKNPSRHIPFKTKLSPFLQEYQTSHIPCASDFFIRSFLQLFHAVNFSPPRLATKDDFPQLRDKNGGIGVWDDFQFLCFLVEPADLINSQFSKKMPKYLLFSYSFPKGRILTSEPARHPRVSRINWRDFFGSSNF